MLKRLHKLFVEIHRIYNGVKPYEKCRKCMKEFRKVLSISMESMAATKLSQERQVMLKKINKSKLDYCGKCFNECAKNQLKDMSLTNQNNTL